MPLQNLRDVLSDLVPKEQSRIKNFKTQYGKTNIGSITVDMVHSVQLSFVNILHYRHTPFSASCSVNMVDVDVMCVCPCLYRSTVG